MTRSLPAQPVTSGGADDLYAGRDVSTRVVDAVGKFVLHATPRTPDRIKHLLLRRAVTIDGNTLDAAMQLMLAAARAGRKEGLILSTDVAVARRELKVTAYSYPRMKADVTSTDLSIPLPAGPVRARHYRAREAGAPLLVYYHGGGFVVADIDVFHNVCEVICDRAGINVLSVDYRLAPEHKAPAAHDDAYAAYLWAREHATELGADARRVAVGGDSAGGNLAAAVTQRARDEDAPPPVLALLLYPMTNFAARTRSMDLFADGFFLRRRDMDFCNDNYLGGSGVEPTDPRVSPLLAEDLSGLPPALLVTAGFDPLRDEGRQYAEALRAAGGAVDAREFGSLIHSFPNFAGLGGGSAEAFQETVSALRAHLSRS